jgi:hypothetical protein
MAVTISPVQSSVPKKRSPLPPTTTSLTSNQISMGSQQILHAPKNGKNPYELFVESNRSMRQEDAALAFEASVRKEIEYNYFASDKWDWNDLYDKDNLRLCLSAIKLNKPKQDRNRIPAFLGGVLSECTCRGTQSRNNTDNAIVQKIERNFPDKEQRLRYVSFGCDGCFPDWVILSHLVLLGYKNVEVHLTGAYSQSVEKMKEFFGHFNFTVSSYKTFREFTETNTEPADIVLALDFNGDLDKGSSPAKLALSDKGFALTASNSNLESPNWELVDTTGVKLEGPQRNMKVNWPKLG